MKMDTGPTGGRNDPLLWVVAGGLALMATAPTPLEFTVGAGTRA